MVYSQSKRLREVHVHAYYSHILTYYKNPNRATETAVTKKIKLKDFLGFVWF